jgi:hypothetical protein
VALLGSSCCLKICTEQQQCLHQVRVLPVTLQIGGNDGEPMSQS